MTKLVDAKTTTGAGSTVIRDELFPVTSALGWGITSAGAGAATITIEVSNDNSKWIVAGTLTLTLATTVTTTTNTAGVTFTAGYKYVRANVTAISGTNAAVTVDI